MLCYGVMRGEADTIDEPKKHPKEIFYAYISG